MRRIFLSLLLSLFLAVPALAAPSLFEGYEWGMSRADVEKIPGVIKGEGEMAEDLILHEVKFAGQVWTAKFVFQKDKLMTVTLMSSYDRAILNSVRSQLTNDGFEVLGFVIDQRALDLFQLIKAEGVEAFQKRFSEILREKTPERMSYEYFQTAKVSEEHRKMAGSMTEFLRMVDMNILQAEVTMLGDGKGSGPQALLVSFFCPVLEAANISQ